MPLRRAKKGLRQSGGPLYEGEGELFADSLAHGLLDLGDDHGNQREHQDGDILGDYVKSVEVSSGTGSDSIVAGESFGGNPKTYYEVTDKNLPAGSDGKVLKITQDNTKTNYGNSQINIYNTSDNNFGNIYVFESAPFRIK